MTPRFRAILLPGLHGSTELFTRFVAARPPQFECTPLELPEQAHHYADLASYLRDKMPRDLPYVLIGESFSGPIALELASSPDPNLLGVVLSNSFIAPPRTSLWKLLPWSLILRIPSPAFILRHYIVGPEASPDLVASVRKALSRFPAPVLAARLRLLLTESTYPTSEVSSVPVVYLRGTRDQLVGEKAYERIRRRFPDVRRVEIPAPHLLLQTYPQEAWKAIRELAGSERTT